mmetsp:Transcript_6361/g.8592  ORF Transcript_6361/g.8592 Transcript_6361/m.8592 type:complete len:93 (+) Transcript_6361:146-424(+)
MYQTSDGSVFFGPLVLGVGSIISVGCFAGLPRFLFTGTSTFDLTFAAAADAVWYVTFLGLPLLRFVVLFSEDVEEEEEEEDDEGMVDIFKIC